MDSAALAKGFECRQGNGQQRPEDISGDPGASGTGNGIKQEVDDGEKGVGIGGKEAYVWGMKFLCPLFLPAPPKYPG